MQLTDDQVKLIEKITKSESVSKKELEAVASLASNSELGGDSKFNEAKATLDDNLKKSEDKDVTLTVDDDVKKGFESKKDLTEEQKKSLIALLIQAMQSANDQLAQRLAKKAGAQVIQAAMDNAPASTGAPNRVGPPSSAPPTPVPPTQVATNTGASVTYNFDPKKNITGNKKLNFNNDQFTFDTISGKPLGDAAKREIQTLIEKTEQKVFDDFLKLKGYTSNAEGTILKEGKALDSGALATLQNDFGKHRSNDLLNAAAAEITKGTKYTLRFMDAPQPANEVTKVTTKAPVMRAPGSMNS